MKTMNALLLASALALTGGCAFHGHGDMEHGGDHHGSNHSGKCCGGEQHAVEAGGDMPMMDEKMHEHMQAMHDNMQKIHENLNSMQDLMLSIEQTKPSAARNKLLQQHMAMLTDTTRLLHDMPMMKDMKKMHEEMKGEKKDMPMMDSMKDDKHTMPMMEDMKKCEGHDKPPQMGCSMMSGTMGALMQHMDMLQIQLQQQMMLHRMAAQH